MTHARHILPLPRLYGIRRQIDRPLQRLPGGTINLL